MPSSAKSTLLLERSAANGLPATYILGSYATQVTFHAQQNRAFNLIWALFDQKIIDKGSKVCVIGGGLAGMTAAAAANLKECKVTLYESKEQLMRLQRGNSTRYIHPNIYDWPHQGSEIAGTKLPCLNWKAAKTEEVIEQIEQEWELVKGGINFQPNRKVNHILDDDSKPRIGINSPFISEKFDCVIIATGFGTEKPLANALVRQYWDAENLHQPVNWPVLPKKFLVTGCGDGGLIDVLRLKLVDFKHEKFTADFLQNESLKELRDKLIEIEEKAPADPKRAVFHYIDGYKALPISESLKANIKEKIRTDTKVSLNSSSPTPLNGVSSILNRFAIYLLGEIGELTYIPGKVTAVSNTPAGYNVVFSDNGKNSSEIFDDVVTRHGPEPVIQDLVPASHVPFKATKKDVTAQPMWKRGFYPEKTVIAKKESKMDKADRNINELRALLSEKVTLSLLGVSGTKSTPVYSIIIEEPELPEDLKDLKVFKGIPIDLAHKQNSNTNSSTNLPEQSDAPLQIGSAIQRGKNGPIGTLGCFITMSNGLPGFISTAHVLDSGPDNDSRVYATNSAGNYHLEIGVVYQQLEMGYTEKSKTHNVDAGVVLLSPRIPFSTKINGLKTVKALTAVGETKLGERVYKIGAGSQMTSGTVKVISAQVNIGNNELFGSILVEGMNDKFSAPGDSGAVAFNSQGNAIGIVVGTLNQYTIVVPLKDVMNQFDLRLFS